MQETFRLYGKYLISGETLYITFNEPKNTKTEISDGVGLTWTIIDEYNSYKIKKEKKVKYHCKYLIENEKLYVYRFDNGKLVKEAETYSKEKGRHMTPYYLGKTSE